MLCGISSVMVWPELSAPTSSINIIIITANYIYVLYVSYIYIHCIAIQVHVPGPSLAVVGGISSDKSGVEL